MNELSMIVLLRKRRRRYGFSREKVCGFAASCSAK